MLVAAKVMPSRITDVSTVPKAAIKNTVKLPQHLSRAPQDTRVAKSVMPKKPTAMPNKVHKNAGVTVISAEKLKKAVRTPTIALAINAFAKQLNLQLQFCSVIFFTSNI